MMRGACVAVGLTFWVGLAIADSGVRIVIAEDAVAIRANNTSMRSILEELSRQTGLVVMSHRSLDGLTSIDIDQPTLWQAIHRLLRRDSFLLHQSSDGVSSLRIFSHDADNSQTVWVIMPPRLSLFESDSEFADYRSLATSDDVHNREEAMYGFGELADRDSARYLQLGLTDSSVSVREEAILSLTDLGGTEAAQALRIALNDPRADVRVDVVNALGEIGGPEAVSLLLGAAADEHDAVREAAAEWLTELAWSSD